MTPKERQEMIDALRATVHQELGFYRALACVRAALRHCVQSARIGADDSGEAAHMRREIERLYHESEELATHSCVWDSDDRCAICGADGRA